MRTSCGYRANARSMGIAASKCSPRSTAARSSGRNRIRTNERRLRLSVSVRTVSLSRKWESTPVNRPRAPLARLFPANLAVAIEFRHFLRRHAGDQRVAIRHPARAKNARERCLPVRLAVAVDLAHQVVVHGGDEEPA